MKKSIALIAACAAAAAAQAQPFVDQARVLRADPQYETVSVPRQECANEYVAPVQEQQRNYGGVIIGGLAGALLGHQVGGGHGKTAATAVGAVVGAMAGDNIANQGRSNVQYAGTPQAVTTCRTVDDVQQRVTGYRVRYEYHGQVFTTFMAQDPGPTLRVRVAVDPV